MTATTITADTIEVVGPAHNPLFYFENAGLVHRVTIPMHSILSMEENLPRVSMDWGNKATTNLVLHCLDLTITVVPPNAMRDSATTVLDRWVDQVGELWDLFVGRREWDGKKAWLPDEKPF